MPEFKCDLVLSEEDAKFASGRITEYYQNFGNMADYLRKIKLERVAEMPTPLFGFNLSDSCLLTSADKFICIYKKAARRRLNNK